MKVGPKGQVAIPQAFRQAVGIRPSLKMVFELRENEILIRKPKKDVVSVFEKK